MAIETVSKAPKYMYEGTFRDRAEIDNAQLPGHAVLSFLNRTQNVTNGAAAALELIEWSEGLPDCGGTALLNNNNKYMITRLAIEAMHMLGQEAEYIREWAYTHHTAEGQAERAKRQEKEL